MKRGEWKNVSRGIYRSTKDGTLRLRIQSPVEMVRHLPPETSLPDAKRELAAMRRDAELAARDGTGEESDSAESESMLSYAKGWLASFKKRARPRVYEITFGRLRDHVLTEIGHIPVDELSQQDVIRMTEAWVAKRQPDGSPYSGDTIRGWKKDAWALIADACAQHRIAFNPTYRVKLPPLRSRPKVREQRTLPPAKVVAMLDWVERNEPDWYAEICLMVLGGLRPSEIYALTWDNWNEADRVVTIEASVDHGHVDAPKTEDDEHIATREQVVSPRAAAAMREHRKRQLAAVPKKKRRKTSEEKDAAKLKSPVPDNLCFPSIKGTHRTPSSIRKVLRSVERCLRLDTHISPQVLRRTYNTILKDLTDHATLHAMIGHSSEEMTRHYSGVSYEDKAKACAALDDVLASAAGRG